MTALSGRRNLWLAALRLDACVHEVLVTLTGIERDGGGNRTPRLNLGQFSFRHFFNMEARESAGIVSYVLHGNMWIRTRLKCEGRVLLDSL